jgi:SPP1 gp7 family putative phage head morphogenesis protein
MNPIQNPTKRNRIYLSKRHARDPTRSLRLEKEYEKELTSLFNQFRDQVIRAYKISAGIREMEAPVNIPMFTQALDQLAQIVVNAGTDIVKGNTLKAYQHGTAFASMTLKRSGHPAFKWMPDNPPAVSFAFSGPNTATYEAMLHNNLGDLTKATEDMKNLIKREMLTGVEKSETTLQIMRRIRDTADLGTQRATVIARTEVMKAVNQGTKARYDEAGVKAEWLTTHDERLCDECAALGGKLTPEETDGLPPAHPNCRCCVIPVAYGSDT